MATSPEGMKRFFVVSKYGMGRDFEIVGEDEQRVLFVDGKQRLTTLTLLLIFLSNLQKGRDDLIVSKKYGRMSFNLEVPERTGVMEKLYSGEVVEENGREEALPFFVDWLSTTLTSWR